ncbi:MBL fold metallo-hydrolase [Actinoplanes sp. NPDC000266]
MNIHPLFSPWGRFGLYSFFIDAPEPAIVDTGIASSPAAMARELEKIGRRIEDVRWILLTHGHIDHVGGAHALWELTGRRARVCIHAADAPLLRSRRAHTNSIRALYVHDTNIEAREIAAAEAVISGEMEPHLLLEGGETLSLGGDITVSVHAIPGHTPGSVAYVVSAPDAGDRADGRRDVFVGDAVQIHGAANGFPGYEDPVAYRASLRCLRDGIRPSRLYLGHPYRRADGTPYGIRLDAAQAREALRESLDIEARIAAAATRATNAVTDGTASPYSPFADVAAELGYTGDPTLEPSPFFTTMHGYVRKAS